MKVVIFGAGNAGKHLLNEIQNKSKNIQVIAFLDNALSGEINGISIYRPIDFLKESICYEADSFFLAAGAQKTLKIMIDTLYDNGIREIYMMHDIAGKCKLPLFENGVMIPERLRKIIFSDKKPTLPYIEIPITDRCNLNCKGCLFACNMIESNSDVEINIILNDVRRMRELFEDIPWIRVLGGEPLMHPKINDILKGIREIFPKSEIDLCTNGLLLPKMEEDFFQTLLNNRIAIHVSGYKPTYSMLDDIDKILCEYGLNYTILKREEFIKYYTTEPDNQMRISYERCIASGCRELYRGRLSRCSAAIAFEKLNKQFGTKYEVVENIDWYDIHNPEIDGWKLKRALDHASHICKYCSDSKMESFSWDYAGHNPKLEDYVI